MKLALFLCVALLTGCSSVEVATGYVVDQYCEQSEIERIALRSLVNAGASPHYIAISCEHDNNYMNPTAE